MNIERGATNTLLVPGRDLQTHYLLVFQRVEKPDLYQYSVTVNSGQDAGPLLLEVEEKDNASATDSEVTLGAGDWDLIVYGQNSSTNLDPASTVREIHRERVRVTSVSTTPPVYPPSGGGSCLIDIPIYVDSVLVSTQTNVDPCVNNSLTINITYS